MRRIALATSADFPALHEDDRMILPALEAEGFSPEPVVWSEPADWARYDAVVIRSIWDYHRRYEEFSRWLEALERTGARVLNPIPTLRWNSRKTYLRELGEHGVPMIDTEWVETGRRAELAEILRRRGWNEAVVKPAISAGAYDTFRVRAEHAAEAQARFESLAARCEVLVQPFIEELPIEGERSLVYFDRQLSHAVLKRAKPGDFRVQIEHGGSYLRFEPDAALRAICEQILAEIPGPLLYARIDLWSVRGGTFLNEVEALEPMLYFRQAPDAAARFVAALKTTLRSA